ncbi:MAG: hypothetical protein IKN91_03220 [Paludibacteraceae bacterium]|nr:hypothetical protein [Paludibacteraceae bacterium]
MRALIYSVIETALENLTEDNERLIKHIDLFNEQVLHSEEEQPFLTPAVFVEFAAIDWQKQLHGVREAVVTVRLHVVTDTRVGKWADVVPRLCLCDDINRALHGLSFAAPQEVPTRRNSVMNDLTLLRSITDHDFDELADNIEEYQCMVTDASAYERF